MCPLSELDSFRLGKMNLRFLQILVELSQSCGEFFSIAIFKHREALYNQIKHSGVGSMSYVLSEQDKGKFFFHSSAETHNWQHIQVDHMISDIDKVMII